MEKAEDRLRNLNGEENGDDDDQHQGRRVGVPLPPLLVLPRPASKDGKSLPVQPSLPSSLLRLLADRQPPPPLLGSPHGREEQDVEDDQGDAGQELYEEATEPGKRRKGASW